MQPTARTCHTIQYHTTPCTCAAVSVNFVKPIPTDDSHVVAHEHTLADTHLCTILWPRCVQGGIFLTTGAHPCSSRTIVNRIVQSWGHTITRVYHCLSAVSPIFPSISCSTASLRLDYGCDALEDAVNVDVVSTVRVQCTRTVQRCSFQMCGMTHGDLEDAQDDFMCRRERVVKMRADRCVCESTVAACCVVAQCYWALAG